MASFPLAHKALGRTIESLLLKQPNGFLTHDLGSNYEARTNRPPQKKRTKSQRLKWDTVIEQKAVEISEFLVGRSSEIDFQEPSPIPDRFDNRELRERINSLRSDEAQKLGLGKSTLHYLRKNASGERSFKVYGNVRRRLTHLA